MQSFDFKGRTVFVAGGTSGINLGIAEAFAEAGANLAVISRSQQRVCTALERLRGPGGKAIGYAADVRNPEAIATALQATHDELGEIDVLISGAAGNFPSPALGMSPNGFKAVIDIDLLGSFNITRLAYEYLRKPGAAIINISAPQALLAMPQQAHVCAAKAGVDMLTRVLAIEWGSDGVRVNAIVPGPIEDTEGMARLAPTHEAMQAIVDNVPLGRIGTKRDVSNLALFLASPFAAYVTGAVIPVDGGWSTNGGKGMTST